MHVPKIQGSPASPGLELTDAKFSSTCTYTLLVNGTYVCIKSVNEWMNEDKAAREADL